MAKNPRSTSEQPRDKAGASVVGWLLVGLVVLFGGLYVAAHYVAGDKVPRNTTVSGVRIGGHPQAEAAQRLEAGLADKVNRDIAATIQGRSVATGRMRAAAGSFIGMVSVVMAFLPAGTGPRARPKGAPSIYQHDGFLRTHT